MSLVFKTPVILAMNKPKVSVIMSVYNGERYLPEAIDSIINQTFKDFEFIIINDGSTDRTKEIVESYDDERIMLIEQANMGLTKSLNRGLRLANSEYIARMDADDISHPERLYKQVSFLEQNKDVGLIGTDLLVINENGKLLYNIKLPPDSPTIKQNMLKCNQFGHGAVMLRKECIDRIGFYREEVGPVEDYDLWLRISDEYDVANICEPLYQWRFHNKQVSTARGIYHVKCALFAVELAKERRQFGKDRLQYLTTRERDGVTDFSLAQTWSPSRKELIRFNYSLALYLYHTIGLRNTLKRLLKSFIYEPLNKGTWVHIFQLAAYFLLPKSMTNALSRVKYLLLPRKSSK